MKEIPKPIAIKHLNAIPVTSNINTAKCDQKAVALPTAVLTAHNKNALNLPIEHRNLALMLDNGGQHTLVSHEAADRLSL